MNYWISTDLDGTLLDHNDYSYSAANEALYLCKQLEIPIVLNTSKTQAETQALHQELGLSTPIIVENGSALVFGKDKRKARIFGQPRTLILEFIEQARSKHNFRLTGFNDLGIKGIVEQTGLSVQDATLAADKHYSEPFIWQDSQSKLDEFKSLAKHQGLSILKGGRFHHLQGQTDKGQPLVWLQKNLTHLFDSEAGKPELICLGDNQNDVAMLNIADHPILVKSAKKAPTLTTKKRVIYTEMFGPEGWNKAILNLLSSDS